VLRQADGPPDAALRLLALFKLAKAALFALVGFGALGLVRPGMAELARQWVSVLAASGSHRTLELLLARVSVPTPHQLEAFSVAAFLYAGLFLIEGAGLWHGRRWAGYVTVVETVALIPLELFELSRRLTPVRIGALALNVAVAAYLWHRLRREPAPRVP
jgi:uncharacterized membrane protein (DUF2068 family)